MNYQRLNEERFGSVILARMLSWAPSRYERFIDDCQQSSEWKNLVSLSKETNVIPIIAFQTLSSVLLTRPQYKLKPKELGKIHQIKKDHFIQYRHPLMAELANVNLDALTIKLNELKLSSLTRQSIRIAARKQNLINSRNFMFHRILSSVNCHQREFINSGKEDDLHLLKQQDLADRKKKENKQYLDTSRVSRIINGNHILLPDHTSISLKNFFLSKPDLIKRALRIAIEKEQYQLRCGIRDTSYTDQELQNYLQNFYLIEVSRQTVTAYRNELHITERKKRQKTNIFVNDSIGFSSWRDFNIEQVRKVPPKAGVYELGYKQETIQYSKQESNIFYIGSSENLSQRLNSHLKGNSHNTGISEALKHPCIFRFSNTFKHWRQKEKIHFDTFVFLYGNNPKYNFISP